MVKIHCLVLPGTFGNEYLISVEGTTTAALVARKDVQVKGVPTKGKPVNGIVTAHLVHQERDKALVELPGEPVASSRRRSWVPITAFA